MRPAGADVSKTRRGLGDNLLARGQGTNVREVLSHLAVTPEGGAERLQEIPLAAIEPSPFQPRSSFDPERLQELADSLKAGGLLQPIVVRPRPDGRYELLAGERRWRAAKLAGFAAVPARVRDVDDATAATIALTENLARQDLSAFDAARGLAALRGTLAARGDGASVRELARVVGWSKSKVDRALQIADGVPADLLERAGRPVPSWDSVPESALLSVAKAATPAEKRRVLRQAVGRDVAERATTARGVKGQHGTPAPFDVTERADRLTLELRRRPAELTPAQARALLERLAPLLKVLHHRAKAAR